MYGAHQSVDVLRRHTNHHHYYYYYYIIITVVIIIICEIVMHAQSNAKLTDTIPATKHHCLLTGIKLYCLVTEAHVCA